MLSFFEQQLTDRGTEFCGPYDEDRHQPVPIVNDVDHMKRKMKEPADERHRRADHKMVLQEFRKRLYVSLEGKPGTVSCRTGGRRKSLHKWGQNMPVAGSRERTRREVPAQHQNWVRKRLDASAALNDN